MKKIKSLFLLFIYWGLYVVNAQNINPNDTLLVDFNCLSQDTYFNVAYQEITDMLEGKDSLNLKRASFLVDWAYMEGQPDYKEYCHHIDSVVSMLRNFININNLQQYRTAGNFALFEYFTKSNLLNGNNKFTYDFEDPFGKKDFMSLSLCKVMKTHKGQCRSLPLYYKILSDHLGAESFLALAPHHMYIKHLDKNNRWVNIELTNGTFSTDAWMISSMAISSEAIRNKLFLDALSSRENIAMMLGDLSISYTSKYDVYDNFTMKCACRILDYFPHYISGLIIKYNTLLEFGKNYMAQYGETYSPFIYAGWKEMTATRKLIESYGYLETTRENYEDWIKEMEREKENILNPSYGNTSQNEIE
ncbi:MAG: hypothetical protein LUG18_08175 [Candidatus Azobacteroides sp.]|nr:hypothetical protein [Candidatus Azobacteroides sp.]